VTALARVTLTPKTPKTEIALSGMTAALDLTGALHLPEEGALLVADLHLEKGSSFARRGQFLPPYDTRETLAALADALARLAPRLVVALGDSFHDVGGPDRLSPEDAAALAALQQGRTWIALGALTLRHEPRAGATSEVAGHLHPVGKVNMRGRSVRRRCFATDGSRLVMPAFGAYTGGLNVCDPAFGPIFPGSFTAHLIGDARIFTINRAMLCRD
jgi:metallophosphoesterase superfamily enzyme